VNLNIVCIAKDFCTLYPLLPLFSISDDKIYLCKDRNIKFDQYYPNFSRVIK